MSQFKYKGKQTIVMRSLAREFLLLNINDKILSVKEYANKYSVGTGTVQAALTELKSIGAIELNPCGTLGTFISKIDICKLCEVSGYGPFLGLLPLDNNINIKGLATGIYECFVIANLPIHILFARGSANRISIMTRDKCDFIVLSKLGFDYAKKIGEPIELVAKINTSENQYGFVVPKGKKFDINTSKIAIDSFSYEQKAIMDSLIEKGIPYFNYLGVQLVDVVEKGEVDAALVNKSSFNEKRSFDFIPLNEIDNKMDYSGSEYVIAIKEGNDELAKVLEKVISVNVVTETQKQVINKERLVTY